MLKLFFITLILKLNSQDISTFTLTSLSTFQAYSTLVPDINIIYPWEGKNVGDVSKTFIFGNINPYVSTITVNGFPVQVYRNGGFIAYVPVSGGEFSFNIIASNEVGVSSFTRKIFVGKQDIETDKFKLISPSTYTEILYGQDLLINFKSLPSTTIYYEIDNICSGYMDELPEKSGNYFSKCYISQKYANKTFSLYFKFKNGELKGKRVSYDNIVKIIDSEYILRTSTDNVVLKNDAGGYIYFLPENVFLRSDMKEGKRYRVILGNSRFWVDDDKVIYAAKTKRKMLAETGTLKFTKLSSNKIMAKLSIYNMVPFSVWQDENKLFLQLYDTNLRTNWVIYDSSDNFVENVAFRQISDNEALFVFNFNKSSVFWGYDVYYSTENSLNIELKFKPFIPPLFLPQPLKGLNIILDPGHSPKKNPPYDGAVSPGGKYEWEINLEIAMKVKEKLSEYGANVYLTRYTNDEKEQVPLQERPRIAKRLNGDIYISIHNNAIPDGEDPYSKQRGFQIYYYHLHSKKLAEYIHKEFLKNINLPDEGLRYGDYHVARITSMPSVLVENAYMIFPEHEELLVDPSFQDKLAQSIVDGIIKYLGEK